MKLKIFPLIIIFLLCSKGLCKSPPPPDQPWEITVPATVKDDIVKYVHLGDHVLKFEDTTLQQIIDIVGSGSIDHSGDAGESQYWVCYSRPQEQERIWFISDGEMGGGDHVLTQVIVNVTKPSSFPVGECPNLPNKIKRISSSFGWVGMSEEAFSKLIGPPSGVINNRLMYLYSGKKPGLYNGTKVEWDVTAYIEVKIENNKVTSIFASHITSY